MRSTSEAPTLRSGAAARCAELGRRIAAHDLDDERLRWLADQLAGLVSSCDGEPLGPWWKQGPEYGAAYRRSSVFTGTENPWSWGLTIEPGSAPGDPADEAGTGSDEIVVRARVTLDDTFAGPPRAVHGGVLAGLFDEVLGALGRRVEADAVVVTGRLDLRFRAPTPLDTELVFEARSVRRSSRRMRAVATCWAAGVSTATAEALLVIRTPRRERDA